MKRLYGPVREGMIRALQDIFEGGFPADKVIQRQLKSNRKWGSHDRRLVAEGVYDIVRWWRKLRYASGAEDHMTVIEAWCLLHDVELGKGIPRQLKADEVKARWSDRSLPRPLRESIPDWLDEWAFAQLGERWESLLPILNQGAPVFLRTNLLKTRASSLVERLAQEKIPAVAVDEEAIRLQDRRNVFLTQSFHDGWFEVQDLHSQRVARALEVEPGMRVIDACAGGGGKSLHLAARMGNKGKVIAMDVVDRKLESLRERTTRAGATCIETRLIEGTKTIKRLHDSADRLLLDVPCSGLGVLRRNPDSKWKLTPEEIQRVRGLQTEILGSYTSMLKPGGRLVYATCSVMPEENERQVEAFIASHGDRWRVDQIETLWPELDGGDGFFIAALTRQS